MVVKSFITISPSLLLIGKAGSLHKGHIESYRVSTRVGPSHDYKYKTKVEVTDSDEDIRLHLYGIHYDHKMFIA